MITLSGTISAADLNANFSEELAAIQANMARTGKDLQYDLDVRDLTSGVDQSLRIFEFVAPSQMEVRALGLAVWNPDATTRTITGTLTAHDDAGTAVPKYLLNQDHSIVVVASSATEFLARTNYEGPAAPRLFLTRGVVYRLTLSCDVASAVDRAVMTLVVRNRWRRQ